ncbi:hypothetical protein F5Y16DRAFT_179619 [Xylariaceae sp. FL0255]|nr:hypothetical protein F5Y16DRAFT_179619 [Xylariaceae sp. FL0255]
MEYQPMTLPSFAKHEDLPLQAEINRRAHKPEVVFRFMEKNWPAYDEKMVRFSKARLTSRFNDPDSQVFRAKVAASDTNIEFICCMRDSRRDAKPSPPAGLCNLRCLHS